MIKSKIFEKVDFFNFSLKKSIKVRKKVLILQKKILAVTRRAG